ncbi:hypothetical protein PYCC9005_002232 [Savitreella phatthalungensis]
MLSRTATRSSRLIASTRASAAIPAVPAVAARSLAPAFSTTALRTSPPPVNDHPSNLTPGEFAGTDENIKIRYPGHGFLKEETPEGDTGKHYSRTLSSFTLEGKVCVVTGGARGLGYTMSQGFIESGAQVAIVDLNGSAAEESAQELRTWFAGHDEEAAMRETVTSGWGCDVSNEDSVKATIAGIIQKHGKIDVLVTSAGFTENFAAQDYPIERVRKLNSVNIDGTLLTAQCVARHWIETSRRGSIICIGSMSGNIVNVPQPQARK